VPAASPLEALYRIHLDGLGRRAVRLIAGQILFTDPADREMCAGVWKVTLAQNGEARSTTIEIEAGEADGPQVA
jgi:hypothetical protein